MTVLWTVKAVEEWCNKCCKNGDYMGCYEEALERFGCWIYSVSYASCFELRSAVERYLEEKGVGLLTTLKVLRFFSAPTDTEVEYDVEVYRLLKEALKHVAETSKEKIIETHAKTLINLITTAEKLKSKITCTG
jgi:hypothetical protein